jgi:hypothetical protein
VDGACIDRYTPGVRIALNIIGALLASFGILWILQGLAIVSDGLGGGANKWGLVGVVVLVAAVVVLASANRRRI